MTIVDRTLIFPADMPSHAAIDALRQALHVRPGETVSDARVRSALRMICEDAHRHGLRAEHLLIWFKQIWRKLPEVQPEPFDRTRNELLQHIISMCIREYYEPSGPQHIVRADGPADGDATRGH